MTPGELFARLWARIEPHANEVVLGPWLGRGAYECSHIEGLFRSCAQADVPAQVERYLAGESVNFITEIARNALDQRAYVVMCALDDAAMDIHPCIRTRLAGASQRLSVLLQGMKAARTADSRYAHVPDIGSVIAKGQLTARRALNEAEDANGANLGSQFQYLTVVPDPRPHAVQFLVVPPYRFGMQDAMAQKIGIAPIAEDADDLTFTATSRLGHGFLDARPTDPAALGGRLAQAVAALLDRGAGIVALPELVCSDAALAALQARLRARPSGTGNALVVCGSGLSSACCPTTGRHFNEATIMTARGTVLYRQQKIHPFNMGADRMAQCFVRHDPAHAGKPHLEDIAAARTLTVCDLPDMGRIIVMICEDFEQLTPTGLLAEATRPDWIFAPVLDVSQDLGRWTHQRCIEIGRRSLSRIVVTSSTTLSVRREGKKALTDMDPDKVGIGILYDGHQGRRVKRVAPDPAFASPHTVFLDWDSSTWPRDSVGDRP